MNRNAILPSIFVFLLPFLNDVIVFGGSGQMDKLFTAPVGLLGNAVFAAAPFLFIGSVMKPRKRVTIALWVVAIITAVIWLLYAVTGLSLQSSQDQLALNFYIYMGLMVWPFICAIAMGGLAKFGEPVTEPNNA